MKIKVVRQSGMPIDLEDLEKFEAERKEMFDIAMKDHANDMRKVQARLEENDRILADKYDTISEIEFLKSAKAVKAFVAKYGSYLVSTHVETGEVMFVIMDQGI